MRTVTKLVLCISLGLLSSAAACSGGDDQGDAGSDSGADATKKDAGDKDVANDVAVTCTADSTYGSVSNQSATYTPTPVDAGTADATDDATTADAADDATTADATDDGATDAATDADDAGAEASTDAGADDGGLIGGSQDVYQYTGTLNADPDNLDIEMYTGFGVFSSGIHTGTFKLTGADLDYATCGLCVLVLTDSSGGSPTDTYMATGGSVTITSLQPTLTGTLDNVTFTHVSIDPNTFESTSVGDGCNSSIASLAISAPVTVTP